MKFDRYWRIFATGLSFAIFGVFGTILTILLLPVLLLTRESPARRKFGKLLLKLSFKSFLWGIQILGIVDLRTKNIDRLKTNGRLILANHPTLIDAIILFSVIDNPNGVIKSTLFNNPSMYGLARIAGLIRNVEGPELIRKSIESITTGENLIIFPEGTRTKVMGQVTFKKGAAYIAIKGKFNIIPVTMIVSEPFLRKNQSWYDVPLKKPVLTVSVLNEIDVATDVNTNDELLIEASKLTKYFEKNFTNEFRMYEQS